jgi:hypothetical protein
MKPTLLLLAAAAVSLILQDRPQAREVSTAKTVYAEELVLHEEGREYLRLGRIGTGADAPHGLVLTDRSGKRRATLSVEREKYDFRYEEQVPGSEEVRARFSLGSSPELGTYQSFWLREGGELSFGTHAGVPKFRAYWEKSGRTHDPLPPLGSVEHR